MVAPRETLAKLKAIDDATDDWTEVNRRGLNPIDGQAAFDGLVDQVRAIIGEED